MYCHLPSYFGDLISSVPAGIMRNNLSYKLLHELTNLQMHVYDQSIMRAFAFFNPRLSTDTVSLNMSYICISSYKDRS